MPFLGASPFTSFDVATTRDGKANGVSHLKVDFSRGSDGVLCFVDAKVASLEKEISEKMKKSIYMFALEAILMNHWTSITFQCFSSGELS